MPTQSEAIIDDTLDRLRSRGMEAPAFRPNLQDCTRMDPREYTVPPEDLVRVNPKTETSSSNINAASKYLRDCGFRYNDGRFYRFDGCYYRPCSEQDVDDALVMALETDASCKGVAAPEVKREFFSNVRKYLSSIGSMANVTEVTGGLSTYYLENTYGGWLIPFENGIYSVAEDKLLPFTPSILFDRVIHARYDPRDDDEEMEELYLNILGDRDALEFFYLAVGYTLYSDFFNPPAIFILLGPGDTGKSAILFALEELLGSECVSNLSLTKLSSQFGASRLKGMAANLCDEAGNGFRNTGPNAVDGDLLKALAAGRPWDSEQKYKDAEKFVNKAKLWFASNSMPDLGDDTSGMLRRTYIFPCNIKQDPGSQIYARMGSPRGKSWLAFKALKAFVEFEWKGEKQFRPPECMGIKRVQFSEQNPIVDFINDWTGYETNKDSIRRMLNGMGVKQLYEEFRIYQMEAGRTHIMIRKNFRDRIMDEYGMSFKAFSTRIDGRVTTVTKFVMPELRAPASGTGSKKGGA